jgi:hypothetical protein
MHAAAAAFRRVAACDLAWGPPAVSVAGTLAEAVVAVDAGHGHKRSGANSARGVPEYRFNLDMARLVVEELHRAGLPKAVLLDADGADIPPAGRARRANRDKAAVLLSIHHDSVQPHYLEEWIFEGRRGRYCDRFAGYSLFFSRAKNPKAGPSLDLAKTIGESLRNAGFTPTAHHAEPIGAKNGRWSIPNAGSTATTAWPCSDGRPCPPCSWNAGSSSTATRKPPWPIRTGAAAKPGPSPGAWPRFLSVT